MGERTWVHAFTDGRDVSPHAAVDRPRARCRPSGSPPSSAATTRWIATTAGSAPDRALAAILDGVGESADDPVAAVRASYERGVTDEFVEPIVLRGRPAARPGARRRDRLQLPARPRAPAHRSGCSRRTSTSSTMTRYRDDFACPGRLRRAGSCRTRSPRCSAPPGSRQLHAAETEKYAHVTYFFNGGVEEPWPGEERILVPSPRDVPSYDLKPEMSAAEVAARVADALGDGYGFCVVNFANPDMVGHTGVDPGGRPRRRDGRRLPRRGRRRRRTARAASASSPPTTATPRSCSRTTASARTRPTRRIRCRSSLTRAARAPW